MDWKRIFLGEHLQKRLATSGEHSIDTAGANASFTVVLAHVSSRDHPKAVSRGNFLCESHAPRAVFDERTDAEAYLICAQGGIKQPQ
mmetsp:Transcript_25000/g.48838  ORF Transcript_25000/g.48838 Transcript_25000/m.48838 type:complete len:87 (-) Transcript_25000:1769-2029(-)